MSNADENFVLTLFGTQFFVPPFFLWKNDILKCWGGISEVYTMKFILNLVHQMCI